ncbi:anion permease [Shigella flexneri]
MEANSEISDSDVLSVFTPAPAGLSELAWALFGIYLLAIVGPVIKLFRNLSYLLIAVAASMVVVVTHPMVRLRPPPY